MRQTSESLLSRPLRLALLWWPALVAGCASTPKPPPLFYPGVLQQQGIEGCVVVAYGVDEDGLVHDEKVVYERPDDSFEGPALKTIEERVYDPADRGHRFREPLVWKLPPAKGADKKAEAARQPAGCEQATLEEYGLVLPHPLPVKD